MLKSLTTEASGYGFDYDKKPRFEHEYEVSFSLTPQGVVVTSSYNRVIITWEDFKGAAEPIISAIARYKVQPVPLVPEVPASLAETMDDEIPF